MPGLILACATLITCNRDFSRPDLTGPPNNFVPDSISRPPADTVAKHDTASKPDTQGPIRILVDSLFAPDMTLLPGASIVPWILVLPANATNSAVELSSLNSAVAEVRAGSLFGAAVGITMIEAHSLDGSDKRVRFSVAVAPAPVKLKSKPMSLAVGNAAAAPQLEFTPPEAAFNGYILSRGDPDIAAISADGKTILPMGPGKTRVKAEVIGYPGVSSTMRITVVPARIASGPDD